MLDNKEKSRFELEFDGHISYADYKIEEKNLYINYVFAPSELRGTGASGKLMRQILEFSKEHDFEIKPICSYAAAWLRKNNKGA